MITTINTNGFFKTLNIIPYLRKIFSVFFVVIAHQISAQISVQEGAELHVSETAIIGTAEISSQNITGTDKIFVSEGAGVYYHNSENNFKVVKVVKSKKQIATKTAILKQKRKSVLKAEPVQQKIIVQNHPEKQESIGALPDSDDVFSTLQIKSFIAIHSQSSLGKLIFKPAPIDLKIANLPVSRAKIISYTAYYSRNICLNSFSIRPPPINI